jgi:flagellar export protein FliJ
MPFHFSLETLLRYRQSLEHQQELLLQEINQQIRKLQREIDDTSRRLQELTAAEHSQMESGLTAAEMQFNLLCRSVLFRHRAELGKEMIRRLELREQRRQTLLHAQRQRKIVDTLREHQFQLFRQQEARQEQRRLDDAFLLRREFLGRG